ncbi:nucleotidyltransferase domain-containing protein [Vibrio alfacsensis]|uniref:Nucleotidyltransferase domain-containing protein n=1 Tax=Vibrio alfacsensis TaxID=1074311 RepID=A0ABM6YWF4_9VIBR|nr:nucleotidyltransferase domain-containing protein [Vibrio alfacsensis]AXY02094.1 nucleotidyltransferase domain-containing protein [Vibrio alfacsensis]
MDNGCLVDPTLIGLKTHQYQLIKDIVLNHDLVTRAWVFGSRALGTFKDNSDIDIALEGRDISLSVLAGLQDRLEQSSLPFTVDLVVKHKITSTELLAHIETHGIKLK